MSSHRWVPIPARKKLSLTGWLGLLLILPALACNFPPIIARPPGISKGEFQQTLTAMAPPIAGSQTAQPTAGETLVPPFEGLSTATPGEMPGGAPPDITPAQFEYVIQAGDTLPTLTRRFEVTPQEIISDVPLAAEAYLPAGQQVTIPNRVGMVNYPSAVLPDSEVVNGPSAAGFSIRDYIQEADGFLSTYSETVNGANLTGADIVEKVALENSINPRVLLAFLEFRSGWVLGEPRDRADLAHPIGFYVPDYRGLYKELVLTATQLGKGYYSWRSGDLTDMEFQDGETVRLSPAQNAASAGVQRLLALFYSRQDWEAAVYGPGGFLDLYQQMFGDPWVRAASFEAIFPAGLTQPRLELPFAVGERWGFTGGPHLTWNSGSPRGALDFSPTIDGAACSASSAWVTASAAGVVTRSSDNVVALDLDGDGYEQTGWVLIYLHVPEAGRVQAGTRVSLDERIGHPSCERGKSTGTHVHIARKYNGEWIPADGPLPFVLSGWEVQEGSKSYQGALVKDDRVVTANPGGPSSATIIREE
jgi:murein DD-endopeptidase MepM/ murein hydrolase activator NlpD